MWRFGWVIPRPGLNTLSQRNNSSRVRQQEVSVFVFLIRNPLALVLSLCILQKSMGLASKASHIHLRCEFQWWPPCFVISSGKRWWNVYDLVEYDIFNSHTTYLFSCIFEFSAVGKFKSNNTWQTCKYGFWNTAYRSQAQCIYRATNPWLRFGGFSGIILFNGYGYSLKTLKAVNVISWKQLLFRWNQFLTEIIRTLFDFCMYCFHNQHQDGKIVAFVNNNEATVLIVHDTIRSDSYGTQIID